MCGINQQASGVTQTNINEIVHHGGTGMTFEKTTERNLSHVNHFCHCFLTYRVFVMFFHVGLNFQNSAAVATRLHFGKSRTGQLFSFRLRKFIKYLQKSYERIKSFFSATRALISLYTCIMASIGKLNP